ncbi:MAG: GNAT family N-acetyltransferase [Planctomycetota bacterium]|jgi:N-acetylglutamate synthase-like GNAT family acetyltransferase
MRAAAYIVEILLERDWHGWARLEAWTNGSEFKFFRNGLLTGIVMYVSQYEPGVGTIAGMGVHHAMHGTGLGRAMMAFVLENTTFETIRLRAAKPEFYKKLGFKIVEKDRYPTMELNRSEFTGSSVKFTPISKETADHYVRSGRTKGHYFQYDPHPNVDREKARYRGRERRAA